jgi:putative hydrolase of the HAD superfamily
MTAVVLFDLDDTLFDHRGCTRDALASLQHRYQSLRGLSVEAMNIEYSRLLEELHLQVLAGRKTAEEARIDRFMRLFAFGGAPVGRETAGEAAATYRAAYIAGWRPIRFALELLAALHGCVAVGVVTNNVALEQRQKISACGFEPFLDVIVISEEAGVQKPDPRIFEIALSRLERAPEDAVMVGNAWETDIAGARAAGIRPVWFNPRGDTSPDPSVAQIHSLEPTPDLLSMFCPSPESRAPNPESRTPSPESR